jgi:hypothetical protein
MKNLVKVLLIAGVSAFGVAGSNAAVEYQVHAVQAINTPGKLDVDIQILRSPTSDSFVLGTSTYSLQYNAAAVGNPQLLWESNGPWDNLTDRDYSDMDISLGSDYVSLVVFYQNFSSPGPGRDFNGAVVPTTAQLIGRIQFDILDPSAVSTLSWRAIGSVTQVYRLTSPGVAGGGETEITNGPSFIPPEELPLPIQLASFTGTVLQNGHVRLDWSTISETNNFGFEVQKAQDSAYNFVTIPNSFIPGAGTTLEPQHYTYTDVTATPGNWFYRLKQIDMDATVHYTDPIQLDIITSVEERPLPTEFALDQNYPNPFNPSTTIEFALPKQSHVVLEVYNVIGQRVATLVDEVRDIGYHKVRFDATGIASGMYFYRLITNETSFLKRMILLK